MSPSLIIDRIEGDIAIIECGEHTFEVPVSALPEGAQEGSQLSFSLLSSPESDADQEANDRLERLKARDSGDDIIDL